MGRPAVVACGAVRLAAAAGGQGAGGRVDAGRGADPGWARFVSGDSRVTRLRLGGLSPEDLTELAGALGLGTLSRRGASRLAAHTEGNALYCRALLEEIGIAALSATGLLGVGGRPGLFNWRGIEADALIGLGRLDDAETALRELEDAIPAPGLASAALTLARCRGNLALARGHAAQAEAAFSRAHLIAAEVPMPFEHALLSLDDGRRLRAAGNRPQAIAQLETAHRLFSGLGADPYVQACATELAALQVTAAAEGPAALLGLAEPSWPWLGWSPPD